VSDSMNLTSGSSASGNLHAGRGRHAEPAAGRTARRAVDSPLDFGDCYASLWEPRPLRCPWTSETARCFRTVPLARERGLLLSTAAWAATARPKGLWIVPRLPITAWAATARPPGRPDGRLTADVDGRRSEGRRSPQPPWTAPGQPACWPASRSAAHSRLDCDRSAGTPAGRSAVHTLHSPDDGIFLFPIFRDGARAEPGKFRTLSQAIG